MARRRKKKEPRTVTIKMSAAILAIDANFDPITEAPFKYREENIYPLSTRTDLRLFDGKASQHAALRLRHKRPCRMSFI
jgi:hypothetical protein